ncbi:MAG TPA: adenylate/guanylate cyclase domain-containing protein [Acidimicrobiales bacterium]|nr:adenylate/guanylate cyclase domain-containing protein [Acidimicrobiales bacterium]
MRVRRTFAFVDLSGFTALTESEGDERAVSVIAIFRSTLREICSRRAVRIAKWLGDGAMLVSVDSKPLLAAALELKFATQSAPEPIKVKCGISVGHVILLEGDDYIGHAVNVAARLCDLADGDQVLALSELVPELPAWASVESTEEVILRGLEQPLTVVHLCLDPPAQGAIPDPVCHIPLTDQTAYERRRDLNGATLLFCSDSCLETWLERPAAVVREEPGSIREVWMR